MERSLDQCMQSILDNGLTKVQKDRLNMIKGINSGIVRESIVVKFVPMVADFLNDSYGRVTFDGKGQWTAQDGGACIKIGSLSHAEALAIDYGARRFAYPDEKID